MRFIFYGTLNELKETIKLKAKEYNKEIAVYDIEPNILEIGFQRLGHSSGRFFIANVIEENAKVILDGEIKNVFPNQRKRKAARIYDEFIGYFFAYILLQVVCIIPWFFFKNIISIWVPLILPIIYLIIRHFLNRKEERKTDEEFVNFMYLCTIYTSDEHNWFDTYKKLNLAGGKLQSISDDEEDMLLITYEDGMQIDVGYIKEEKI